MLPFGKAADFKSAVSTNFTIEALRSVASIVKQISPGNRALQGLRIWRRDPESNWTGRICNPVHNRFAIAPKALPR